MKSVYKLEHKRLIEEIEKTGEKVFETKLLGFFSSEYMCKRTIQNYLKQPGFCDYPDDFVIESVWADIDDYNKKVGNFNTSVFHLTHEYYDREYDNVSNLGYYSSCKSAQRSLLRYKETVVYRDYPDGFNIDEYEIDKPEWTEGFFSY